MSKREEGVAKSSKKKSDKVLPKVRGKYRENVPLAPTTWFRVGGPGLRRFKRFFKGKIQ